MNKRLAFLFISLFLFSFTVVPNYEADTIYGKWEGISKEGNQLLLTFHADGYIDMAIAEIKLSGRGFELDGDKGQLTWKLDKEKNPHHLDISVTLTEKDTTETMCCLLEFSDKDHFKLATSFNEQRPDNFDELSTFYFKRAQK
ncbi:MAG: hypothetical protein R6T91_06440 [Bacteroidales bacterium]